jgi:hypothetical protein
MEKALISYVKELKVVGYSDIIKQTEVPMRVAPIFKFNHKSKCLFSPFRLVDNMVIRGTIAPKSDFEEMVQREEVTKLLDSFPAIPQGMLWIDESLTVHYGDQKKENDKLKEQAYERLKLGFKAFGGGDLETALKCARWASAANQNSLKALALEGAVYKLQNNPAGISLIEKMSAEVPDGQFIRDEIGALLGKYTY